MWRGGRRWLQASLLVASVALSSAVGDEALPLGPWKLVLRPGAQAKLIENLPRANAITVRIDRANPKLPVDINIFRAQIPLSTRSDYMLHFLARADRNRTILVTFQQGHPPWEPVSLMEEVALTPEWKSFALPIRPQRDELNSMLTIQLASSDADVEIADFRLMVQSSSTEPGDEWAFPPQSWRTATTADATARLEPTGAHSMRIELSELPSPEEWNVSLWTAGFPIYANMRYRLSFRLRADFERVVSVGVDENRAPWRSLGLNRPVVATTAWRDRSFEFSPPTTNLNSRLQFRLGGSGSPVEIDNVRLQALPGVAESNTNAWLWIACLIALAGFSAAIFSIWLWASARGISRPTSIETTSVK